MRKIVFLFPGQGSQFIGMGKELYNKFNVVKETFQEANDILGYDIKKICFEGNLLELNRINNMLQAILIVSVATFRAYMEEVGVEPNFLIGHSLGEYSALTCSGVMEFSDAIRIVNKRSSLAERIVNNGSGYMSIVDGIDIDIIEKECKRRSSENGIASVTCYNSPFQAAIAGNTSTLMEVEDSLLEYGAQVTPLLGSPPFHCSLMETVVNEFREEIQKYTFNEPKWTVISNATGVPYTKEDVVDNLVKQIIYPVQWNKSIENIRNNGATFAIEMGPKGIFMDLINTQIKGLRTFSYNKYEDKEEVLKLLKIDGKVYQSNVIDKCLATAVGTENIGDSNHEYIVGVNNSYNSIKRIREQIDREGCEPTPKQIESAVSELENILSLKNISEADQDEIISKIHMNI